MRRLLMVLMLACVAAPASATPQADTDELMARELYSAGETRFERGDYRGAISAFLSSDLLAPSALNMFAVAVCHERLGNGDEAARYYRAYLRRDPDAVTYRIAQDRIARLDAARDVRKTRCDSTNPELRDPLPPPPGLGEVTIVSQPARAEVFCHGRRLGETPLRVAVARQRNTRLVVSRRGFAPAVLSVDGDTPQPVLQRLAKLTVHPDLKDPMEDLR